MPPHRLTGAAHSVKRRHAVTNLKKEGLAMIPLLSLRGAEGDEAISVEGGDMCIDVVAGFIPALWSVEGELPCA